MELPVLLAWSEAGSGPGASVGSGPPAPGRAEAVSRGSRLRAWRRRELSAAHVDIPEQQFGVGL